MTVDTMNIYISFIYEVGHINFLALISQSQILIRPCFEI